MPISPLSQRLGNYDELEQCREKMQSTSLAELFEQDSNRANRFLINAANIKFDYSKNWINEKTLAALVKAAEQIDLKGEIAKLFRGDTVNNTENRPALHSALRANAHQHNDPQNEEQTAVAQTLEQLTQLVESVHNQQWRGFSGKAICDVVNIGIGGSDLGPRMVVKALTPYHTGDVSVHFIANIDGAEIHDLLQKLNPESTLFIVASKSFSTLETLENSLTARRWMLSNNCSETDLAKHFVAISSKVDKAVEFGIAKENVFPMWDWVGGRYSLWSAIGLSIALAIGIDNFNQLRAGAEAMDKHFKEAPLEKNMPAIMGLLMFWYSNFFKAQTQAILPYAHHMQLLPAYLQQLEMESNGKSVNKDGQVVDCSTGSIVWGTEGTNGQHSFHQLLHQGTHLIPIDFIATLRAHHPLEHQHRFLFANCIAQSQALLTGRSLEVTKSELKSQGMDEDDIARLAPHKVHPGNRPSSMIVMEQLTPETLGALIAAYEHKVFTVGVMSNINSFDQWGVELGKLLGTHVNNAIETTDIPGDWDSSTKQWVSEFCQVNQKL